MEAIEHTCPSGEKFFAEVVQVIVPGPPTSVLRGADAVPPVIERQARPRWCPNCGGAIEVPRLRRR